MDLDSYLQAEVFLQKPPGLGPGDLVDSYSYLQAEVVSSKAANQPACLLPCFVPSSHLFCFLIWRTHTFLYGAAYTHSAGSVQPWQQQVIIAVPTIKLLLQQLQRQLRHMSQI